MRDNNVSLLVQEYSFFDPLIEFDLSHKLFELVPYLDAAVTTWSED